VPVGHKKETFEFMLELHPVLKNTVIMAKVQLSGGTHSGQYPLLGIDRTQSRNSFCESNQLPFGG
jgi:hypothetical protein